MKKILGFSIKIMLLVVLIWACSNPAPEGDVLIKGHLPGMSGKEIYLEELEVKSKKMVDSVRADEEGNFAFNLQLEEAGFYILGTSDKNQVLLLADKGENIVINSDQGNFSGGYTVTGSPGSQLLLQFEKVLNKRKQQIDSLAQVYYAVRGAANFLQQKAELDSAYRDIVKDHRQFVKSFIEAHPGSLASLIVLNRRLGNTPVIDEEKDFHLFHITDSALMAGHPENKHTLGHHKRVKEIRLRIFDDALAEEKVLPGKQAPDIVLNDTAGEPFSLKSYLGHPVIVYFWAGWNAKSREDNQQLKKLYNELSTSGVKILGVSLDENRVVWKGAVNLDSLPWKQVSDLEGLNSKVKKDYNLPDELPFYYLLDEDHKIRYKNNDLDSVLIQMDKLIL